MTSSTKRRQRHKRLAMLQSLPLIDTGDITEDSTLSSISAIHDSFELGDDTCCDKFFIGDLTCSVAVQTDLSTQLGDSLVYATDPAILLQALVHNLSLDLMRDIKKCETS